MNKNLISSSSFKTSSNMSSSSSSIVGWYRGSLVLRLKEFCHLEDYYFFSETIIKWPKQSGIKINDKKQKSVYSTKQIWPGKYKSCGQTQNLLWSHQYVWCSVWCKNKLVPTNQRLSPQRVHNQAHTKILLHQRAFTVTNR